MTVATSLLLPPSTEKALHISHLTAAGTSRQRFFVGLVSLRCRGLLLRVLALLLQMEVLEVGAVTCSLVLSIVVLTSTLNRLIECVVDALAIRKLLLAWCFPVVHLGRDGSHVGA